MLSPIARLAAIVETLRSPQGCPWDREQTHASLKPQIIEEVYELIEAIDSGDDDHIIEELGDVLLHVLFHAQIAAESRRFNFDDVANRVAHKLVARHPHVFQPYPDGAAPVRPRVDLGTVDAVLSHWHRAKQQEKASRQSALDGIAAALPALLKAQKTQERAHRVGFDWKDPRAVLDKVEEELRELRAELGARDSARAAEELGDLLFSLVNLIRFLKLDAEEALNAATAKFAARFRRMEELLKTRGKSPATSTLEEMDAAWNQIKSE